MESTAKVLYEFLSGFDLPAYDQNAIPDDAELPYITYYAPEPSWDERLSAYAQVWYRTKSRATVNAKTDEIIAAIGAAGVNIPCDGGYIYIWPVRRTDPVQSDSVLGNKIEFFVSSYHMPGV